MNVWVVVVVVGLAALLGFGIYKFVKRRQYVSALRARGWQFESSPGPEITFGLTVPPFGLGYNRATNDLVTGRTSTGVPFQVFEFLGAAGGRVRLATVLLPVALPELVITAGPMRARVAARPQFIAGLSVASPDNVFAQEFMAVAGPRLGGLAQAGPLDVTVDGDQLVAYGVGTDPDAIAAFTEALAGVAQAVAGHDWGARRLAPPERVHGFYREPTWRYLPREDSWLGRLDVTRGGKNHQAVDVLTGEFMPGSGFVMLTHKWQTTRVVTEPDGRGGVRVRTVTDNHSELVFQVDLPFDLPALSIGRDSRWARLFSGRAIDFESAQFNAAYDVWADNKKYAYDIVHPRMIEYLMALPRPLVMSMSGRVVRMDPGANDPQVVGYELAALAGFMSRIPPFVWQNLRLERPLVNRLDPLGGAA